MIKVENLCMQLGAFRIEDVSFSIPTGRYGLLMGKTGCGKTSIMEAICGLKPVLSGRIELNGEDVTDLRTGERGIGFVPQDIALFKTMTVYDHLAFGPRVHRWHADDIAATVPKLAEELGITYLLERKPFGLSGGERQRVAIGRALSLRPHTLLLDEPLSAIDEETRETMCRLLKSIQENTPVTIMHVTHSSTEAKRLADCVFRFKEGKVIQQDHEPATDS